MKKLNLNLLEKRLGYDFKDKNLLTQALTHKSANHQHNERLEFLGDAILNFIIADLLYLQFISATEGELTRARASLVNKSALHEIALSLELSDHLHLGIGEQRSGGFRRESILADTVEAILGAMYLDSDFEHCRNVIVHLFHPRLTILKPKEQIKDPKTRLQEWLQAHHKPLPKYHIISIIGEPHAQTFTISCEIEGCLQVVQGIGASRRIAEQEAARKMLELIHENK
ncbi:MAG: ribonuclease III [Proteobacteria bacterium]|nr:ribonuclease III [Pseudomonadota bacterium]